jgi:hypothetical protein
MAYTTIDKPTDYFNTKLYTGNNSTQSITGVGFQPDWTWIKSRGTTTFHNLYDSVRGATKIIQSNTTTAEQTFSDGLTSFDSDGFSLGSRDDVNGASYSLVSWNWLAGGTASSNTDGDITSSVSANTTAGFSVVTYTGSGTGNDGVGHGLGVKPNVIFVKHRTKTEHWAVHHDGLTSGKQLYLNLTNAEENTQFSSEAHTSSVFKLGTNVMVNLSGDTYVAYCFAEKKGYSKFGSYTGNGNSDGTFVYTGFKPSWVMIKRSNSSGEGWHIYDNKRNTFNLVTQVLTANLSNAEATASAGTDVIDMLSQGFKCRGTHGAINGSSNTYIYMAFAENPFVTSTGIPCTAR